MPKTVTPLPETMQRRITDRLVELHRAGMPLTQRKADGTYIKRFSDGRTVQLDLSKHDAVVEAARRK